MTFPRPERIDELAAALRVDVSELFAHPDHPPQSEIAEAVRLIERIAKRIPDFPTRALKILSAIADE